VGAFACRRRTFFTPLAASPFTETLLAVPPATGSGPVVVRFLLSTLSASNCGLIHMSNVAVQRIPHAYMRPTA
jgi:hypothetical protein